MTQTTRPDAVEALTFSLEAKGTTGTLKLAWDNREYSTALAATNKSQVTSRK
jgi:hypothetical protein